MHRTGGLLALLLLTACQGLPGVGVPGGLNARRVELAQPVVHERILSHELAFDAGKATFAPGARNALIEFLAYNGIEPGSAVAVAVEPATTTALAEQRRRAASGLLSGLGLVPTGGAQGGGVGSGDAALLVVRQLAVLPPAGCAGSAAVGRIVRDNEVAMSRFGCATANNLGLMVVDPGDLIAGRPMEPTSSGERAALLLRSYKLREHALDRDDSGGSAGGFTPGGSD
jgi:pilus assembly protein CpaD